MNQYSLISKNNAEFNILDSVALRITNITFPIDWPISQTLSYEASMIFWQQLLPKINLL